jgi:chromosome segregation ATPase
MWALEDYDAAALLVKELQGITETAQKNFDNASQTYDEYASQISGNGVSYDTILQKQETISDLQKQLEQKQMYFTEAEYRAAYDRYIRAKQAFDEAYGKVSEEELQTIRTEMNTAAKELSPLETKYQEIQALQNRLSAAQQDYWQAMMQFSQSSQQNSTLTSLREVRDQEAVRLEAAQKKLAEAEADCSVKKKSFEEAKVALDDANTELKKVTGYREYDTLSDEIKEMKKQLAAMEDQKSDLEKKREASSDANVRALEAEIRAQNTLVTTEKLSVSEKEQEIRDLKADIAEAEKKASAKAELDKQNAQLTLQQYQIELEQIQDKIRKQEELVARLEENQVNGTVVAPVSGIIESLSVSAGQEAAANTPIASITLSDMGYTMKCTVTNEQAAKVNVGDVAEIQWYYWGDTPSARVVSIKTDPSSQGQRKTITLDVTGEVSPGTSLTFTLGSKNATYDCVVPNSAVREDSNGTFVLVVTAKDTPLGNRYSARRVDVEILASDETNSAVTGLASGEYVITKSSAPISSGMQVRLSENT